MRAKFSFLDSATPFYGIGAKSGFCCEILAATDTSLVLAHMNIAEKSNEIPVAQTLLAELGIAGRTITLDGLPGATHEILSWYCTGLIGYPIRSWSI